MQMLYAEDSYVSVEMAYSVKTDIINKPVFPCVFHVCN